MKKEEWKKERTEQQEEQKGEEEDPRQLWICVTVRKCEGEVIAIFYIKWHGLYKLFFRISRSNNSKVCHFISFRSWLSICGNYGYKKE